jgi:hypothetical protein
MSVVSEVGVAPDEQQPPPPPRSRVAIYYVILIAVTAAVVIGVIVAGSSKHAQPMIAGGYDVSSGAACLGAKADVIQSGQFVSLSNTQGTLSGELTYKHGRLTGTVDCIGQLQAAIDAHSGNSLLIGTIGGLPWRHSSSAILQRRACPCRGPPARSRASTRSPRPRTAWTRMSR